MTREDEDLLLKDLAARVPYGVIVEQTLFPPTIADKEQRLKNVQANNCVQLYWYKYINEFVPIHCIKPYLRQMSNMTDEEEKEFLSLEIGLKYDIKNKNVIYLTDQFNWLNAHHFDYCGLIEKGLALEAPEGMYKK